MGCKVIPIRGESFRITKRPEFWFIFEPDCAMHGIFDVNRWARPDLMREAR